MSSLHQTHAQTPIHNGTHVTQKRRRDAAALAVTLRTSLLFAMLCVCWGIPYFLIKVALVDVSPVCVAWGRITLAALVLLPIAWQRRSLASLRHHKGAIVAFAVTELVFPFSLIALAESRLSSAMTGILVATVPLIVVVIAPLFGVRETLSARRLGGLIVGFAGASALLGFDTISDAHQWLAVAWLAVAIVGYAAGPLVVQRHLAAADPIGALAASLGVASVLLLPAAIVSWPLALPSARSLICIVILGAVCTACAMLLYFHVIHAAGAARASIVAYVSPAIAAVLGVGLLHEHFGAGTAVGLALILLGSAYGSSGSHNQLAVPDA